MRVELSSLFRVKMLLLFLITLNINSMLSSLWSLICYSSSYFVKCSSAQLLQRTVISFAHCLSGCPSAHIGGGRGFNLSLKIPGPLAKSKTEFKWVYFTAS